METDKTTEVKHIAIAMDKPTDLKYIIIRMV
jgi:hypothetical protein